MEAIQRDISKLYLPMRKKLCEFLGYANSHMGGLSVFPFETLRKHDRQVELHAGGASTVKYSWHEFGLAVDLYPFDDRGFFIGGKALDDWPHWEALGQMGKSFGFEWGGDWKSFKDLVHFQMPMDFKKSILTGVAKNCKGNLRELWSVMDSLRENNINLHSFLGEDYV